MGHLALLLALGFTLSCEKSAPPPPQPPPGEQRWEMVNEEYKDQSNVVRYISAWHDLTTGQEFVCVARFDGSSGVSCFLTGRNWKGAR